MRCIEAESGQTAPYDGRFILKWVVNDPAYDADVFRGTLCDLVRFPERTSSAILRANITAESLNCPLAFDLPQWTLQNCVSRDILPKNPKRDATMSQNCYFYIPAQSSDGADDFLVIFEPLQLDFIPFYHPQVAALGFHYSPELITIAFLPLPRTTTDQRLDRTLLQLLTIIDKHSTGTFNNYQKRVQHDVVVGKEDWQDQYLKLKDQYAETCFRRWVESTDPKKHVFEDLGIASFLLNLWRQRSANTKFVDIGCGNGLLVDLLTSEGCVGFGFDARRRKSWKTYASQTDLRETILCPSFLNIGSSLSNPQDHGSSYESQISMHDGNFDGDAFLIGNHADELTPFIPLLAAFSSLGTESQEGVTIFDATGFMIIPCCTYAFDGHKHPGLTTVGGRYAAYIDFLLKICKDVGWVMERENLRIPSTRNVALLGRRRSTVENAGTYPGITQKERLTFLCKLVVQKHGGAAGFAARAMSLTSSKPRAH